MLSFLPGFIKGILAFTLLLLNLLFWVILLSPFAVLKLAVPLKPVRSICNVALNFFCTRWAIGNGFFIDLFSDVTWDIQGDVNYSMKEWYLVLANHQSWTDIVVLQYVLNNRIPYFRFFLKRELVWIPIFNFVWAALDYPYMKRYSKAFLEKHPHLKGKDIETTKKSCEKFRDTPVSIMNFVEGTRFTKQKHKDQKSSFEHLLKPKAGGVAFVLSAMGDMLTAVLDVTIAYEPSAFGIWDFLCGKIDTIRVRVKEIPVTEEIKGDYFNDPEYREKFQLWVNKQWEQKDKELEALHAEAPTLKN